MKKVSKKSIIKRFRFAWQLTRCYNFDLTKHYLFNSELSTLLLLFNEVPFRVFCKNYLHRLVFLIREINSSIDSLYKY